MRELPPTTDPRLLTSPDVNEDAAVVRLPDGRGLVQTVDFFTPIVNDPYKFGRIAAANALSDVYAMDWVPAAIAAERSPPPKPNTTSLGKGRVQGSQEML